MPVETANDKISRLLEAQEGRLTGSLAAGGGPMELALAMLVPPARQWLAGGDRTAELDELLTGAIALAASLRSDTAPGILVRPGAAPGERVRLLVDARDIDDLESGSAVVALGPRVQLPDLLHGDDPVGQVHAGDAGAAVGAATAGGDRPAGLEPHGGSGGVLDS